MRNRRILLAYRVAAAALPVTMAAIVLVTKSNVDGQPALGTALCGGLLGAAYYLGRTRPAPGTGQRLNMAGKVLSVIPVVGLMLLPGFAGLYRLTRRRLFIRNLAGTAAISILQVADQELEVSTRASTVGSRSSNAPR